MREILIFQPERRLPFATKITPLRDGFSGGLFA
jgi:hypothetical protein